MKTIKTVIIIPVYVEDIPPLEEMKELHVYISKKYGVSVHRCLCGCGIKTVMPIDCIINGKDHGWKLIEEEDGRISFTPSISNYQEVCKSHYIITKNKANFV